MKRFPWLVMTTLFVLLPLTGRAQAAVNVRPFINTETVERVGEVATLRQERVTGFAWSPDGTALALGSFDGVWLFKTDQWAESPRRFAAFDSPVNALAYSPDGRLLATVSGPTLRLWDVASETELTSIDASGPVAFSPDSSLIAATDGSDVRVFETTTLTERWRLPAHRDVITALAFGPTGQVLASASTDTTARLWDMQLGEQIAFQRSRNTPITSYAFHPAGFLAVIGAERGVLRLQNLAMGTERRVSVPQGEAISQTVFSADGDLLIFSEGTHLHFWNVYDDEQRVELTSHEDTINALSLNPTGTLLVTADLSGVIRLWGVF